jgi:replicative superfamily II helicase
MPPVTKVGDQTTLVPTKDYPFGKFTFENFNPVQSRIFDFYDKENNAIIAAATSAGKTVVAEMFMSHEIRKRGGKAMFLAPLRALAQEKIDDWTSDKHHWADKKIVICTGDYKMTPELREKLIASDVIIMTSEMLNSRGRNNKSENNSWIKDVGTLVVDESHLLTVPGRGDHLEAGLMKFTEINPNARLVLLSATMPNVGEIADWVSYSLTGKDTVLLSSTYRPCPLTFHYEKYWDGERSYEENELQKVKTALGIVEYYEQDKFIVFVHTKKTGEQMKLALQRAGVECEYHNADLEKDKRVKLERRFREDPKLRVIVATSTLAWGLNMPARRVVITGVHRGLDEVPTYDIMQMAGRAGRPAYDPMGDVYILIPEQKADQHKARLQTPQKIQSQMIDLKDGNHKVLAFHIVSEMYQGNIKTKEDVHAWFQRSLAKFQAKELNEQYLDEVLNLLRTVGAIWLEEDGTYSVTAVGRISSLFYYSPFDVADLKKNFTNLFQRNEQEDDLLLAMALGNQDTHRGGIVSKADREEMGRFAGLVSTRLPGNGYLDTAIKAGYAYYTLLNGLPSTAMAGMQRGLQFDFPRLNQVLYALDTMAGKWNQRNFFRRLQLRIAYGVKGDMVYLCQLPNVGKVRATKLWDAGIKTVEAVAKNASKLKSLLNMKQDKIDEIVAAAKAMKFQDD